MKCKIKKHHKDNTTMVEYVRINNKQDFRYVVESELINKADGDVYLFIDTNSKIEVPEKNIPDVFEENGIEYVHFKVKGAQKQIFGVMTSMFKKKKNEKSERMYIAKINSDNYSKELFADICYAYDIALGFAPKMSMVEMKDEFLDEMYTTYFNEEYFDSFAYDSILFKVFRSTNDITEIIEKVESEIS